jgi:hypothetical protein
MGCEDRERAEFKGSSQSIRGGDRSTVCGRGQPNVAANVYSLLVAGRGRHGSTNVRSPSIPATPLHLSVSRYLSPLRFSCDMYTAVLVDFGDPLFLSRRPRSRVTHGTTSRVSWAFTNGSLSLSLSFALLSLGRGFLNEFQVAPSVLLPVARGPLRISALRSARVPRVRKHELVGRWGRRDELARRGLFEQPGGRGRPRE